MPRSVKDDPAEQLRKERGDRIRECMDRAGIRSISDLQDALGEIDKTAIYGDSMIFKVLKGAYAAQWDPWCERLARLFAKLEPSNHGSPNPPAHRVQFYKEFINGGPASSRLDFPAFGWVDELVTAIDRRMSVWLPLAPGSGEDELEQLVQQRCRDTRVVQVDLSLFERGQTVSDYLQRWNADAAMPKRRNEAAIASALLSSGKKLVMLVIGAGGHVRERGKESLSERIRELERFVALGSRPPVVVVFVSPVPIQHLLPFNASGSRLSLSGIWPTDNDLAVLEAWVKSKASALPVGHHEKVLREGLGQLGPIRVGLRTSGKSLVDAMVVEHQNFGGRLFWKFLGPCCIDAVQGKAGREACVRELQRTNIVHIVDGKPTPIIPHWSEVWGPKAARS